MRVLLVTEAAGSGTLRIVTALAAGLLGAGHEVTLAHGRRPETPGNLRDHVPEGCGTVELPWSRRSPGAQLTAAGALRRLAARVRPDVVHLHSSFAGTVGTAALRSLPLVYTPHGHPLGRTGDGPLARGAYRTAERFVASRCLVAAVSEAEAAIARERSGARAVRVVRNGVPELDEPPAGNPGAREPLVVGLGRVGPARRPEASARILRAVAPEARVRWIGDAPGEEAASLHAAGIPVTGWLEHPAAMTELARATVLLHFSAWDGAPVSVLEAMARDVVVVASDIPANRELLGPEQVRRDEAGAAALVRAVVRDPERRARLIRAQRERARRHGARRMVEGCLAVYEEARRRPVGAWAQPDAAAVAGGTGWS